MGNDRQGTGLLDLLPKAPIGRGPAIATSLGSCDDAAAVADRFDAQIADRLGERHVGPAAVSQA